MGMQITEHDTTVLERSPTVSLNTSLGREFYRSATWEEPGTTVKVTAIAFVTGIRARRNDDGSIDLLDQITRFGVLGRDEYVQPVEVALFMWDRKRTAWDGTTTHETDIDHSNEVGLFYSPTVEAAEEQCRIFMESLDFDENFDPAAWK
jgi:hypothetical protein